MITVEMGAHLIITAVCSVLQGTLCMLFNFKYLTLLRFAARVIRGALEYKALIDV